jgi:hypothetical protein
MSTPEDLTARLQRITADLDGYLDRRARELAAPIIAEHQAAAGTGFHHHTTQRHHTAAGGTWNRYSTRRDS